MRIITTSLEDFINAEIAEHGFDYVEAQFVDHEPQIVNGVWCWVKVLKLCISVPATYSRA